MALNLAVKEGTAVYIDDEPLKVVTVAPPDPAKDVGWVVLVEKKNGARYELERIVRSRLYVQLGLKNQFGTASLVFAAPREVVILTEKNFRALQPQPDD